MLYFVEPPEEAHEFKSCSSRLRLRPLRIGEREIRMPTLKIMSTSGESKTVEAKEGITVMEVIRDSGFGDLLALCGGGCSCGTCHVFVDGALTEGMPSMSSDENDLLDASEHRRQNSRLACQICVTVALDGAVFTVAQQE